MLDEFAFLAFLRSDLLQELALVAAVMGVYCLLFSELVIGLRQLAFALDTG